MRTDQTDINLEPDLNSPKGDGKGTGRGKQAFARKKLCRFCADKNILIDYKDPQTLKYFVTERGKITPRRLSGNCAKHQRKISLAVKRARIIALMPFTMTGR